MLLSALCGVLTTQGIMAREVLMPHVFQQYSYAKTLSYSQIADQSGLVLGPLAAALILEVRENRITRVTSAPAACSKA